MKRFRSTTLPAILATGLLLLAAACGGRQGAADGEGLSGTVRVDGSSTVFPISEAMAEEFQLEHPGVRVTVGVSGTGGGFKKFCRGETDLSDASRPIDQSELDACAANGVELIELPVAFDGIAVVVHPDNGFVDHLTVDELRRIWRPDSGVRTWNDVRAAWPQEEIRLYGPGTDSGTFDYFTEAVMGESGASRSDFTASEDDNVLVQGISGDRGSLGYFGFAYYEVNTERLKLVPIVPAEGADPVPPTPETISDGDYRPLSRPLLVYVGLGASERPEVEAFVQFYLDNAGFLAREVGYVALPDRVYELASQRFRERVTGSVFVGGAQVGITLESLLQAETGGEQAGEGAEHGESGDTEEPDGPGRRDSGGVEGDTGARVGGGRAR